MQDPVLDFDHQCARRIESYSHDKDLLKAGRDFMERSLVAQYSYNFRWMGRPIIQYPQDIVAMQELVWEVQPDLIVETGIAHGGSLMLSASLLALLDIIAPNDDVDRKVIGIDIDIRSHNREAIDKHPLSTYITMIESSSVDPQTIATVKSLAEGHKKCLVCLDSNHTHQHVLAELEAFGPLVSIGSYCVVFDTIIEEIPGATQNKRPWGQGNSPMTAIEQFLDDHHEFAIDVNINNKLVFSAAPRGYLKRLI